MERLSVSYIVKDAQVTDIENAQNNQELPYDDGYKYEYHYGYKR